MKTISQIQIQRIPAQDWNIAHPYVERARRLYQVVAEIAEEVRATIAGIFGMPFRHPGHDKHLERLDQNLLADIGYERAQTRRIDHPSSPRGKAKAEMI
jgi:hypothetical protein